MTGTEQNPSETEAKPLVKDQEKEAILQAMKDLTRTNEELKLELSETSKFVQEMKVQKKAELIAEIIELTKGKPENYTGYDINTLELVLRESKSVLMQNKDIATKTTITSKTHVMGIGDNTSKQTAFEIKQEIIDMFDLKDFEGNRIVIPDEVKVRMKNFYQTGTSRPSFGMMEKNYTEIFQGQEEKEDIGTVRIGR